jgi:integrase/recombinase XerD
MVPRRQERISASARQLWAKYRATAEVTATIHQLRHAHASELVNAGVSLETIRPRLGQGCSTGLDIRARRAARLTGAQDREHPRHGVTSDGQEVVHSPGETGNPF